MSKFHGSIVAVCCLLSFCLTPALSFYCMVDVKHTLNDRQPLILQPSGNAFAYPAKSLSPKLGVEFFQNLRLACPNSTVIVKRDNLNVSEATARCYGLNFFQILTTRHVAPLNSVRCAQRANATALATKDSCPNGSIVRVGYQLADSVFVPTIPEICHSATRAQTMWAHHKIVNAVRKRQLAQRDRRPAFDAAGLYPSVNVTPSLYTAESQRKRLQTLLNNATLVNMTIPEKGDNFLVEGMLVPRSDMFYKLEQQSTYFYVNTVPVWKSISEKNWRYVSWIVRGLAKTFRKSANLDVWTGGIGALSFNNSKGVPVNFTLATTIKGNASALPVPRHLFKYVVDQASNRGVVFLTLNDPRATEASAAAQRLCEPLDRCRHLYPKFGRVERGYTYCCGIDSTSRFHAIARELGLPLFPRAEVLVKPYLNGIAGDSSGLGENAISTLNSTLLSEAFWYLL